MLSQLFTPQGIAVGVGLATLGYYIYRKATQLEDVTHWSDGCCPPGSEPALTTDYKEHGEVKTINGLSLYTVGSGSKVVIVFNDIFGWKGGRTREIADQLADQGYRAVVPDFFHGQGIKSISMNIFSIAWNLTSFFKLLKRFPWAVVSKDVNEILIPYLEKEGATSIGGIGFCWGSWALFHAAANPKIRAGVSLHPSLQIVHRFGEKLEELVENVKSPQLLLPAGNDDAHSKKEGEVIKILRKKPFGGECAVEEFPAMKHGWVTRGDLRDKKTAADVKRALDLTIAFLNKHL